MNGDFSWIQSWKSSLGLPRSVGITINHSINKPWLGITFTSSPPNSIGLHWGWYQLHPRPGWNVHPHHSASPSRSWYCRLRGWDSISVLPIQFTGFNGEFQAKFPTKIPMNFIKWRIPQKNPMSWKRSSNTRLVNTAFSTSVSAVMRLASCSCCLRAVVENATESMLRRGTNHVLWSHLILRIRAGRLVRSTRCWMVLVYNKYRLHYHISNIQIIRIYMTYMRMHIQHPNWDANSQRIQGSERLNLKYACSCCISNMYSNMLFSMYPLGWHHLESIRKLPIGKSQILRHQTSSLVCCICSVTCSYFRGVLGHGRTFEGALLEKWICCHNYRA